MQSEPIIDVVVLCGGLGTRFRQVTTDIPKALAPVAGKPILDHIMDFFRKSGHSRFVLCTGYMSDAIQHYYKDSPYASSIVISKEPEPRGTGGAVKYGEVYIQSDPFFVVNGDSYCEVDLQSFIAFHGTKPDALVSIAISPCDERSDAGAVRLDGKSSSVVGFYEKEKVHREDYMNTGIYLFNKSVLPLIPESQSVSLEYDLFPKFVNKGLYGFVASDRPVDIGTPERYREACKILNQ